MRGIVGSEGQLLLRFEQFGASGPAGDESRALFSSLKSKLQREAQMVLRETGLRTLWLAYPVLFVPNPSGDESDFLLAPLFLWPLKIVASGLSEGEIILARDKEGGAPRFNRVATAWIRRYLDFAPAEPTAATIREIETLGDLEKACKSLADSFRPALEVALGGPMVGLPRRDELIKTTVPSILNSGLIGLIQWENQELIQDLERLLRMEKLEGAAGDFLADPGPKSATVAIPDERDRYLVTDTDASQERAVWMARGDQGVVVHGPPGTGKSQVIVNIVADALAHDKTVLVVCQKKAALDVVAARLRARGLSDLCLQVDDAESDRARVIESLKTQRRPETGAFEQERRALADTITRVEAELDTYRCALFDLRESLGVSYRRMLGRITALRSQASEVEPPGSLRSLAGDLRYAEVERLARLFDEMETVHAQARPSTNPWRFARPEVGGTPDEVATIGRLLEGLEAVVRLADGAVVSTWSRRVELLGDLAAIAESAVKLREELSSVRPALRRVPKHGGLAGQIVITDRGLGEAVSATATLLQWQNSATRGFVPGYHRARRKLRLVLSEHPWLVASYAPKMLEQIARWAIAVQEVCRVLTLCEEWLEREYIQDLEATARRGESVITEVVTLRDWLPTLPMLVGRCQVE